MSSLINVVILGAGGHGRETLDIVEAINRERPTYRFLGFADDGLVDEQILSRHTALILGNHACIYKLNAYYVLGIGNVAVRRHLDETIGAQAAAVCLIHPQATVGSLVNMEPGVLLAAGARVTTNVVLGRHTHLNVNAVVSHDCRIGNYVSLSPGVMINGNVIIEDDVFVGTGAMVLPGLRVGRGAIVGAGAVVIRDVPAGATVVGVPAVPIRKST